MVDVEKLKRAMRIEGFSIEMLADKICLDRTTLYRRFLNNGESFKIGEIERIVQALGLSEDEAKSIFFASKIA